MAGEAEEEEEDKEEGEEETEGAAEGEEEEEEEKEEEPGQDEASWGRKGRKIIKRRKTRKKIGRMQRVNQEIETVECNWEGGALEKMFDSAFGSITFGTGRRVRLMYDYPVGP